MSRRVGVRMPAPVGAVLVGLIAMASTDTSMAALGVSHLRQWSAAGWLSDLTPHLVYGAVTDTRWLPWTTVRKNAMTTTTAMLETYPKPIDLDRRQLTATIDALTECAATCTACADACLSEDMVADLTKCISSNLDCAEICGTASRVLARHTGYDATITTTLLQACIAVCRACGSECSQHASMHEHCRICAESCRACLRACQDLLGTPS